MIRARSAGFGADLATVGGRALRSLRRDPEAVIPPLFISAFFYAINVGSLQQLAEASSPGFDYKAFQLASSVIFGITGISRAQALVTDIQSGYFDRLLLTPVRRVTLLLGLLVADFTLAVMLVVPIVAIGYVIGVRFETGIAGIAVFIVISACWAVSFAGLSYAIALKTGSPTAVNNSFLIFFPFGFLTTSFAPLEALTSWLRAIARLNPVTYLLEGQRSLIQTGWDATALAHAALAVAGLGAVSLSLAFAALKGRVKLK